MKYLYNIWLKFVIKAIVAGVFGVIIPDLLAATATPSASGASMSKSVAAASTINSSQLFQVVGGINYSYFFVYDYTRMAMENAFQGLPNGNYTLTFQCEKGSTHVGYIYDYSVGRYVEVLAYLQQML